MAVHQKAEDEGKSREEGNELQWLMGGEKKGMERMKDNEAGKERRREKEIEERLNS